MKKWKRDKQTMKIWKKKKQWKRKRECLKRDMEGYEKWAGEDGGLALRDGLF